MKLKEFLKDKLFITSLLIFAIITIEIFLSLYPVDSFIRLYISITIIILYFIGVIIEYIQKNIFYKKTLNILNELDEKYLITEIIKQPSFQEGKILKQILEQVDKSMIENIDIYKRIIKNI